MKILFVFFVVVVFGLVPLDLRSQTSAGVSSDGRDFYLGYIQPSYATVANPYVLAYFGSYALVSSYTDNSITVSYFDDATGYEFPAASYVIAARTSVEVPLSTVQMTMSDPGDLPQYRACHIVSDHPVNVQFFSKGVCSGGSYLALATPA
ncbi:MAG: hypothetical protein Q8916_14020, partial [Bacteroidota bacterium]|nr:hypothetical protein [Bacteroidota bacterium]